MSTSVGRREILICLGNWPSKDHPYTFHFVLALLKRFPNLQLFVFSRGSGELTDFNLSYELAKEIRRKTYYKWGNRGFWIDLLSFFVNFFLRPQRFIQVYLRGRSYGMKRRSSLIHMVKYYQVLKLSPSLVYVNALQTFKHFNPKIFFKKAKIIASSRGQDFDFGGQYLENLYQEVNHLHVLGDYLAKRSIEFGFKQSRVFKIPPALKEDVWFGDSMEDLLGIKRKKILLTVARLFWTKGQVYGIRAFSEFVKSEKGAEYQYHLVGDGPEREFLNFEIKRLGLESRVKLIGWKNEEELISIYKTASVYMLLSIEEGFNNSVLQAQAMGLPCIVFDTGGLSENVVDGETGFVVPKFDSNAVVSKLLDITGNEKMATELSKNGILRARKGFGLTDQVSKFQDLFEVTF